MCYLQFPEITAFIMRRFKGENDVEETYDLVRKVQNSTLVGTILVQLYSLFCIVLSFVCAIAEFAGKNSDVE